MFLSSQPAHLKFTELSSIDYGKYRSSLFPLWSIVREYTDTNGSSYYGIVIQHNKVKWTVFDVNNASLIAEYTLFIIMISKQFRVAQQFTDEIRQNMTSEQIL